MKEAPSHIRVRAALLPSADVDAIAEVIYKIATGAISSGPHQSGIPGLCWYRMAGAPVEAIKKLLSPRDPRIVKMTISKTGFSLADIQLGMLKEELVRALLERPDHNFPSVDIAMGYKTAIHHLLEDKPSIAIKVSNGRASFEIPKKMERRLLAKIEIVDQPHIQPEAVAHPPKEEKNEGVPVAIQQRLWGKQERARTVAAVSAAVVEPPQVQADGQQKFRFPHGGCGAPGGA